MDKSPVFSSKYRGSCFLYTAGSKDSQETGRKDKLPGLGVQQLFPITSALQWSDWLRLQ